MSRHFFLNKSVYDEFMKHILLLQSRLSPDMCAREVRLYERELPKSTILSTVSTVDLSQAWTNPETLLQGCNAVIIGGSGDFDLHGGREELDPARVGAREILERLRPLIRFALDSHFPLLGICFGHQLIAEVQGGEITGDPTQKKFGSHEVEVHDSAAQDPLFSALPATFTAQYGHKDAVTKLPEGATLLASGPDCRFSALRYGSKIYSTQFHPEMNRDDMIDRFQVHSDYLPPGLSADEAVRESREASELIRTFVEKIVA